MGGHEYQKRSQKPSYNTVTELFAKKSSLFTFKRFHDQRKADENTGSSCATDAKDLAPRLECFR